MSEKIEVGSIVKIKNHDSQSRPMVVGSIRSIDGVPSFVECYWDDINSSDISQQTLPISVLELVKNK